VSDRVCWVINRHLPQPALNVIDLIASLSRALFTWLVISISLQCASLMAATVVITNERSGDLVFMDELGDTLDVVPLCARPKGMAQHQAAGSLFIACSDDNQVLEFDITNKKILRVFSDLSGATSLAFHERQR